MTIAECGNDDCGFGNADCGLEKHKAESRKHKAAYASVFTAYCFLLFFNPQSEFRIPQLKGLLARDRRIA